MNYVITLSGEFNNNLNCKKYYNIHLAILIYRVYTNNNLKIYIGIKQIEDIKNNDFECM